MIDVTESFPNRYPEDYELITKEELIEHLSENKEPLVSLIDMLNEVLETDAHHAHSLLLQTYETVEANHLWGAFCARNQGAIADMRHSWHLLKAYSPNSWPRLANVTLSERSRCVQLEPTSKHFIGQIYNCAHRLSVGLGNLLAFSSSQTLAQYRAKAFAARLTKSRVNRQEKAPLNPLMSEQYYDSLTTNVDCYRRVVQLQRAFGGTPALLELNTYDQGLTYAKMLNDVTLRFDNQVALSELEFIRDIRHPYRALESFNNFMKKQEEYLKIPFTLIDVRELPRQTDVRQMALCDLMYIAERVINLRSDILNTLGIYRVFAMIQTTYQRIALEHQRDSRF